MLEFLEDNIYIIIIALFILVPSFKYLGDKIPGRDIFEVLYSVCKSIKRLLLFKIGKR